MRKKVSMLSICLFAVTLLYGQIIGIKTNILMDATKTFNLGAEIGLSRKSTLDLSVNYNPWTYDNNKMSKMLVFQPEYRYWFCERFNGHFVGIHAHGGIYQFAGLDMPFDIWKGLKDHRFKGYLYGAGISYGYQWILSKHWNLEGSIGVGYARVNYEQYECKSCGSKVDEGNKNYFGPTKAAISLIYIF